jgi:hypothetical protein
MQVWRHVVLPKVALAQLFPPPNHRRNKSEYQAKEPCQ